MNRTKDIQNPNELRAVKAWGENMPEWIRVLAHECDRSNQRAVAKRVGYSDPVISQALNKTYVGDIEAVQKAVEGAFLNAEVTCPVMGVIAANTCLTSQRRGISTSSAMQNRVWRACRAPCQHFRGKVEQ